MFIASNISSWLPGVLTEAKVPDWVINSQSPIFILYGLASGLNMLMLKKFVFEKEINSEFSQNKKQLKLAKTTLSKKERELKDKEKEFESVTREVNEFRARCSKQQSEISTLNIEVETLQISVDGLHGSLLSQIKRHASLKAERNKDTQQYNTYEKSDESPTNTQYGKML
ncbi:hypothetical protein HX775_18120 [Serratia proteamaculans]|uniref:hypothetical protein n=1 Tax=Serratia proteamaculans TaxID=28151 RepID=UPI00159F8554|nr:hypothetical protein [Serratia proteamaculans]NWA73824.1 hypothetical protein [Serratia proteamaculans]